MSRRKGGSLGEERKRPIDSQKRRGEENLNQTKNRNKRDKKKGGRKRDN